MSTDGIKFTASVDTGLASAIGTAINKEVFPLLHQAVKAVAAQTAANWQTQVYKAKLWSVEKDKYAQSISWKMTGDFSAVVQADYKWAQEIETGRPQRDLKKMLNTSLKVRRTTKGKRFLVIPFRHNTPGHDALAQSMPPQVYEMAKQLEASMVTGNRQRPSGEVTVLSPKSGMAPAGKQKPFLSNPKTKGAMTVSQNTYQWGDRLSKAAMKAAGVSQADRKRYDGMVRFETSTPKAKSSAYMTFRIMMEGSKGWIVPAQPGQFLAKKVVDEMRPKANAAFAEAIKRTVTKK